MVRIFNKLRYRFVLVIVVMSCLSACKKELQFEGGDNYIQSFSLKTDNSVFTAALTGQDIVVKAADDVSLDGASASIRLSENARIYPDPATITKWDEDQQFVVTAHNGEKLTYKYSVERSSVLSENSVVLATQSDVDEFKKLGVTEIAGSLVIGEPLGKDSITDLSALMNLKKIGYSLVINSTYAATKLTGFDKLTTVGGAIKIESVKNLAEINFPELRTAGSIFVLNLSMQALSFPKLTEVNKFIDVNAPIAALSMPNLRKVGELFSVLNYSGKAADVQVMSFPSLKETGGLIIG
ncbi:MAG: hypothetical protein EOO88_49670, partial [Pedobacter sp.]